MGHLNQLVDDGSAQPAALSLGSRCKSEVQIAGPPDEPHRAHRLSVQQDQMMMGGLKVHVERLLPFGSPARHLGNVWLERQRAQIVEKRESLIVAGRSS